MNKLKQDFRNKSSLIPLQGLGVFLLFFFPIFAFGQGLTLENCQEKAKVNYPLVKQYGLIEQTNQYNISNANKGYLPQLSLSVRATYQSDAISINLNGMQLNQDKDQYQAALEASQLIWDGGIISAQKNITKAGTEVDTQKLEVDLYNLNERVNQLFFGILLLDEQVKQTEILQDELEVNFKRVVSYKENGVANQSDLDAIKVEQINANQRATELKSTQKAYKIMLGALMGRPVEEELVKPEISLTVLNDSTNNRPELKLLDAQNSLFESQKSLLHAGNLPKIGLFGQVGYGKPGLNMLYNGFSDFYMGGIRLSWNFSGFYTQKNNINKLEVNKKMVDVQKETFLFNTDLKNKQQQTEIEKLQNILSNDDEIIRLRGSIKKASNAKLENGTLTVTDLIRDINAENVAKQTKSLHEIQLLMTVYQLKNNINK